MQRVMRLLVVLALVAFTTYSTTLAHVLHGYAPRYTSVPAGKKETNQPWKESAQPAGK